MDSLEKIRIVTNLQKVSHEVFNAVIHVLRIGMSEVDIARTIKIEFEKRGISEFWYTIPIVVLVGVERFKTGSTTSDYAIKSPSKDVFLKEGSPVFIDLSPMDPETKIWGDWASTVVFHPRKEIDDTQVALLKEMEKIHSDGIIHVTAKTTGADVANYYRDICKQKGITLMDVRNNVGHSMHEGPKDNAHRIWLDHDNINPLGEGIFAVEIGGACGNLVGRFEGCIYIPKVGSANLLTI